MALDSGDVGQYPVYLGIWTNWSRGQVLGLTLTLKCQKANLLIAFTAFFFAFNAVYHQRQAILRNSSAPEGGIQQLMWLIWANRDRSDRFAPLVMVTVALLCIITFTTAGGLSSQITTAVGTEVLIRGLNCGILQSQIAVPNYFELESIKADSIDNAANYAQQCYSTGAAGDCGRFVTKSLTSYIDDNAPCPFEEGICRSNSKNLRIDSGYISSHKHLGLNSPLKLFGRNVLHCSPIITAGYTSQQNTSLGNITLYHYGSALTSSGWHNYTFAAKSIEDQYVFGFSLDYLVFSSSYRVSAMSYLVVNKTVDTVTSDFIPIRPILREDADVALVFLSGEDVVYSNPSTDEWYRVSATQVNDSEKAKAEINATPIYLPLEPASPLACAYQYQFCYEDIEAV
ncbi:hypothetical protein F4680DRAFT_470549 [Xylaria scruposa]|nr:hypothetical protein F4680DRAFT_470549 [Xylaria scruposa]